MDGFYTTLLKWQQLLGALLGFSGVILTLVLNQRHSLSIMRENHDHNVQVSKENNANKLNASQTARRHEEDGVRSVLIAEISDNVAQARHWLEQILPHARQDKRDSVSVPGRFEMQIYNQHLGSLRMLGSSEIKEVIVFYNTIRFMTRVLLDEVGKEKATRKGYDTETGKDYFNVAFPECDVALQSVFSKIQRQGENAMRVLADRRDEAPLDHIT